MSLIVQSYDLSFLVIFLLLFSLLVQQVLEMSQVFLYLHFELVLTLSSLGVTVRQSIGFLFVTPISV
mgnify:CR=1 FL=1